MDEGTSPAAGRVQRAERDRIFESFYQLDNDLNGGLHSGLGLGLSIVQLLVQLMEGHITVSDKPGGGSIFTVFLPFTPALPDTVTVTTKPSPRNNGDLNRFEKRRGRSVLIVEDEAINRLYIQRLLKEQDMKAYGVGDGEAAVTAAASGSYDLILMDMGLPKMSGLEATRNIRQAEAASGRKPIPIAALTANAYPHDREECTKAGMNDFISKPFAEKTFWAVVDRLLSPADDPSGDQD